MTSVFTFHRVSGRIEVRVTGTGATGTIHRTPSGPVVRWDGTDPPDAETITGLAEAFLVWQSLEGAPPKSSRQKKTSETMPSEPLPKSTPRRRTPRPSSPAPDTLV